nr:alkaline phosphatase [Paenibacillus oenotherae]
MTGLALTIVSSGSLVTAKESTAKKPQSKNLIVLIGDGMGPAQVTAARLYSKTVLGKPSLALDQFYIGQATTFADRGEDGGKIVSGAVTDSASAGTAFATGNKTYNAGISVSNEDVSKPYASVIEAAELSGKATGLVSTARITHATPAVYASHVRSRDNESAIASQYLESGVDVLFGGGEQFFLSKDEKGKRSDKSILNDFTSKGYKIVRDGASLKALNSKTSKALGFFGSSHIAYTTDRDANTPNLATMTGKALELLSADKDGFAIMIEGGRIDHASHANDFPTTIKEMLDFDAAVKVAMDFAKKDGNTSVVITADHETGGLSLSRDNIYELNIDQWGKQKHSSESIVNALKEAASIDDIKKIVASNTAITDLSDEEAQQILDGDGSSYGREGGYNAVVSKRLLVGWAGHGHSAVDVGVWGYGPITSLLKGQIDNTRVAQASAQIIGVDLKKATEKLQAKHLYPKFKVTRDNAVLYPAQALAEALGGKYKADANAVIISKANKLVTINLSTLAVKHNGTEAAYKADLDNGKLYLPLSAFNHLTGKTLKWDSLSERIVLQ